MSKRFKLLIYLDVLRVLRDGPLGPTKLARACNLPFDRLDGYLTPLLSSGMVRKETAEGRDTFVLTQEGMLELGDAERVLARLNL